MLMPNHKSMKELIELLRHSHSPKRRSAARRLRKLKDIQAGEPLLDALKKEMQDPRTWETQYQMIMALGECGYRDASLYLFDLASLNFDATMVYVALGDAIVRLGRENEEDPKPVLNIMKSGNEMLIDGAFRAVAMLHLKLDSKAVRTIIDYASSLAVNNSRRFWVVAAAAGWNGEHVRDFLESSCASTSDFVRDAAGASLEKEYQKHNPL
jgi:HEAT repeat protein